jgi:hypothetical protein
MFDNMPKDQNVTIDGTKLTFTSFGSVAAAKDGRKITIDINWDKSSVTKKWLAYFLGLTVKVLEDRVNDDFYEMKDLS